MGVNADEIKGKAKQAIGAVTGDEHLKREGRVDERTGQAKQKVGDAIDAVRDKVGNVVEKIRPEDKE